MPEPRRSPFEYAIVRVVPRVERGEMFNAGIVLLCRPRRFLDARVELDPAVLRGSPPTATRRGSSTTSRRSHGSRPEIRGRTHRPAQPPRALPLAGCPEQHDRPALGRPYRPDRRPAATLDHLFETLVG